MLARAVGGKIESEMREMVELMLSAGLSLELTSALQVVAEKIPNLQREIQGACPSSHPHTLTLSTHMYFKPAQ